MEVNHSKQRFKLLFEKFLEPNYELNSYYADQLIKHLECNADVRKIIENPFFSDLILHAMLNIDKVTESAKVFIMNLSATVMQNELQFSKLMYAQDFQMAMMKLNNSLPDMISTRLRLAFIQQVEAQISHSSGLHWVLEQKFWLNIFNCCYKNQSIEVVRAAYKFLGKFVWKVNELDDEITLIHVLEPLVRPFVKGDFHNRQEMTNDIEKRIIMELKPSVGTLLAVLDNTENIAKPSKVIELLSKYFILEAHLYIILEFIRDEEFVSILCDLTFRITFIIARTSSQFSSENEFVCEGITYYNIVQCLVQKRMVSVILDFAVKCNLFWWKMSLPSTFQRYGRKFAIQDQLIAILIVPYLVYISDKYLEDEDYREGVDIYTMKLSNIISEQIVKASYSFRDLVEESDKKIVAIQATKQIFKLKGHINSEQAGTIYQALFYVLKQQYITDSSGALITTDTKLKSADDFKLISLTLDAVIMLLKDHDINWYESCEIVCLYNCLMNLLKPKLLPSKLVMQILDLVNLTVKKFLPPDLSLLMESRSGSALMEIAEVISAGMIDREWEVRDSAMHLLLTCTEISFVKYIPFQKLISVNGLITAAAHIAISDPEHYVQGMALRCLAAAARVDSIWSDLLMTYPHINLQLMYVLRKHPEGLVRKEAVNVLTEIYANQKVFLCFKNNLYCIMGVVALDDLHWEVQLAALQFLRKTIQSMLADCGMIDGKFPSVTFSKEKRKIVTLTKEEIQKQLAKILNELARLGILSVFNKCMNEEFNISVMEQAYIITKELVEILSKYDVSTIQTENYKYPINISFNEMDIDLAMDLTLSQRNVTQHEQDKVINSIISMNHSELIENMYDNHVEIKTENMDEDTLVNCIVTPQMYLDPNEFLNDFRNNDYLSMINEKKLWNSDQRSLNSLLDEILSIEGRNCIDLECS